MNSKEKGEKAQEIVRIDLEKEFNTEFYTNLTLPVMEAKHEFDVVSQDKTVVAMVKCVSPGRRPNGNKRYPKIAQLGFDICLLEKVEAEKKFLYIGDHALFEDFLDKIKGMISSEIEVRELKKCPR